MFKFYLNSTLIEAIQWRGDNTGKVSEFVGEHVTELYDPNVAGGRALIITNYTGAHLVMPRDWIVKNHQGEVSRFEPEAFQRMYEPAGE